MIYILNIIGGKITYEPSCQKFSMLQAEHFILLQKMSLA